MEIRKIEISALKPYEKNPRRNNKAVDAVVKSIEQFGFKVPIVIDGENVIIAGHTRYKAAQKLGLESVPCICATDLTPEQIKAFRLTENKTAELAKWDLTKLGIELAELSTDLSSEFNLELSKLDSLVDEQPKKIKPKNDFETVVFTLAAEQLKFVEENLSSVVEFKETYDNPNQKGNALYEIVRQWAQRHNCGDENGNRDKKSERA